jgi:transcriptional regulator with XRE-family HTH domain
MGIEKTKDGILNFRNRKHLNQTKLAKILKIKPANVSKWESGKNNFPSFKAAEQLLEMGITVEELFGIKYNEMHHLIEAGSAQASDEDRIRKIVREELEGVKKAKQAG